MALLETQGIVKQFDSFYALDNVSISIQEGSIFGLLGPNGAGKTTLIRIINQITAPDQGDLLFNGARMKPEDVYRIGYLPEERGLYKKMKVGEQAMYLAQLKGLSKNEATNRLKYWFNKFEIQGWWEKKVEELSKGMQQKLQFVTTVIHKPRLLIFDEPFSGFDPINANLIKQEILNLKNEGATVIFSTHNMGSVEELCDHIALINKAKNILSGNINTIKEEYKPGIYEIMIDRHQQEAIDKLGEAYKVLETKKQKPGKLMVKIQSSNEQEKDNALLSSIIPNAIVHSFKELIPSMNDVFIKAVQEQE